MQHHELIHSLYAELNNRNECPDMAHFIEYWMSRTRSYLNSTASKGVEVTITSWYLLYRQLQKHDHFDLALKVKHVMDEEADSLIAQRIASVRKRASTRATHFPNDRHRNGAVQEQLTFFPAFSPK